MLSVRASSLGELFDCPARWEARHIRKLRLPRLAAAQLGTAVHAGTALFDQSRLDGSPLSADESAGAVVDALQRPSEDVDWEDTSAAEVERIALPLHGLYCREIAPRQDYVAVEATCESLTFTDIGLTLTGTVDRVRATPDGLGIADIKTGKTAVAADGTVRTQGHAAQIAVYEILAGHAIGRPAWSAQFLIATLNQSGKFSALRYEFQGKEGQDDWGCRAVATELATKELLVGPLITISLAKKEGWYSKKDKNGKETSKWQSMPELMLRYRAAAWFVRAYAPEIAMGLQTVEEVRDALITHTSRKKAILSAFPAARTALSPWNCAALRT
ncbi:PD-(D/E)XK nuclease family protein [Desulfovibrio sp. ZJ369]|uniref:RecB family exonuclease n=1 Tax=Desulfovibrio sp. ZJ369 TaxID=2709793 RepID=UPI00198250C5|nr:PD-(D/E)XK nuclease family protein [Desulfovibrio sp. ZJ369]